MASSHFILVLIFSLATISSAKNGLQNLPIISFDEGYSHLFGNDNMMVLKDGKSVHLTLDERTGF